jgi:alpha-1,6-mannosyltransferase
MVCVDINTFYAEKAGGIRTYHRAKLQWFARHPEHTYYLVYPGTGYREEEYAPNVHLIEVYGIRTSREKGGYRLIADYRRLYRLLREIRPDVVEAGEPWLAGLFSLLMRRTGLIDGLLVSFYHSDPIRTWVAPWAQAPGRVRFARHGLAALAARAFYGAQKRYDLTVVTSRFTEEHLHSLGVERVARTPFGVEPRFFGDGGPAAETATRHLLYAGRLGTEKGAELLLEVMPRLLERPDVRLTVMGRGKYAEDFAAVDHPRYTYLGFVSDPEEVAAIYRAHDIFLAPGPHETFGLGVLEAMAAGLVVIGPDRGGTGELLREMDSPFIYRAGDPDAFYDAIVRAIETERAPVVQQARAVATRYGTWDQAIERLVSFYQDQTANRYVTA